jgi:hypothetical protein
MAGVGNSIEAITRAAMRPGAAALIAATAPVAPVAAPVAPVAAPAAAPAAAPVAAPVAAPSAPGVVGKSLFAMPTAATVRMVLGHDGFAALVVFAITSILLLVVNPPFVHAASDEPRNALEAAPCSYGRVMAAAAVFAVLAALVPFLIRHRGRFVDVAATVQKWVASLRAPSQ